jgi:DNA-directed RNA polymerase subunit M/transcription elongation factor TFIIS
MSKQIRADKQWLVAAMGVGSAALTGVILGAIQASTGLALYSLMLWFIIPVGALIAGFAAASGYYFGARIFHQKPAGGVLLNMLLAAISAYLLVHYVPYHSLEVDGRKVRDFISFWTYLDLDIRHTSLSYKGTTNTGELGGFGYVFALIQLLGFSIGSGFVFLVLFDTPFCKTCSTYLQKTKEQDRYTSAGEELLEQIKTLAGKLDERKYVEAIKFHADRMGIANSTGHHLKTQLTTHKCKTCASEHLSFGVSRLEEGNWKSIPETQIQLWFDRRSVAKK